MQNHNDTIESFVINSGLVSRHEVADSINQAKKQGVDLATALLQTGKITDSDLSRIYAHALGVPFINLDSNISFEVISTIPEPISRVYSVVAYNEIEGGYEVAIKNLEALEVLVELQNELGVKFFPRFATSEAIKSSLLAYQRKLKNHFGDRLQEGIVNSDISTDSMIDTLIQHAILQNASDIHIEPREKSLVVRYRILGQLKESMILPLDSAKTISLKIKEMSGINPNKNDTPQNGMFRIRSTGHSVTVRVSTFPTFYGEKVSMKIFNRGRGNFSLEGLGCNGKVLEDIQSIVHKRSGVAIFSGQLRAGVSTTLYSILDILSSPSVSISTIEDDVEYNVPNVNQTQVRENIGLDKAEGLRSILLQDPDVVMVSSCENPKVLDLMTVAARRGKLVISSIVAKSAPETLIKILSESGDPENLLNQLELVSYQRLVKRLGDEKEKYHLSDAGLRALAKVIDSEKVLTYMKDQNIVSSKATWKNISFYRPTKKAGANGFKGSVAIFETLPITQTMREEIKKDFTAKTIFNEARKEGYLTAIEDGVIKAVQGYTTIEEVLRAA